MDRKRIFTKTQATSNKQFSTSNSILHEKTNMTINWIVAFIKNTITECFTKTSLASYSLHEALNPVKREIVPNDSTKHILAIDFVDLSNFFFQHGCFDSNRFIVGPTDIVKRVVNPSLQDCGKKLPENAAFLR